MSTETLDVDTEQSFDVKYNDEFESPILIENMVDDYCHRVMLDDLTEILAHLDDLEGQSEYGRTTESGLQYVPKAPASDDGQWATFGVTNNDNLNTDGYSMRREGIEATIEAVEAHEAENLDGMYIKFECGDFGCMLPVGGDYAVEYNDDVGGSEGTVFFNAADDVSDMDCWGTKCYHSFSDEYENGVHFKTAEIVDE